jgi:hypothetical protein
MRMNKRFWKGFWKQLEKLSRQTEARRLRMVKKLRRKGEPDGYPLTLHL